MELWKEISREEVFRKYGRGIEKIVYKLPHGEEADFYVNSGHPAVACLALTKNQKVILVKQFRPGPQKFLLDLPGGGVDEGETAESAMARELLEETGYQGKIQFLTTIIPSAYATYIKNALVATDCEKIREPILEENGEASKVLLVTLEEFRNHLRSGQCPDLEIGYLGLDHLGLL